MRGKTRVISGLRDGMLAQTMVMWASIVEQIRMPAAFLEVVLVWSGLRVFKMGKWSKGVYRRGLYS